MSVRGFLETYFLSSILLQRDILRERKEFALADEVRNRLSQIGIKVVDTPEGSTWTFDLTGQGNTRRRKVPMAVSNTKKLTEVKNV